MTDRPTCPACGQAVSSAARFCRACGAELPRNADQGTVSTPERPARLQPAPARAQSVPRARLAALVAALLVAGGLLGYAIAREDSTTHYLPRLLNPPDQARRNGPFRVGDTVALGPYAISVRRVVDPLPYPGPSAGLVVRSGLRLPPHDRAVRVDVTLANLSQSRVDLLSLADVDGALAFRVRGQNGKSYASQFGLPAVHLQILPVVLAPKSRNAGSLLFFVPRDVRLTSFQFEPYIGIAHKSGQAEIALR